MSRTIKKGTLNQSIDLYIIDSTDGTPETGVLWNTSGIDLKYRRELSAVVSVTEATLAALTTAHADGGFLEIGNGVYRFDLPDLAVATGAASVVVYGTVTNMIVLPVTIQLVDYDPMDTVRLGLTAMPNAAADAAGGLPISDVGGLDLDAMNTNINDIETDTAEIGAAGVGLTAINLPNQTMDITGDLSGSVGSVTGAVGSVTGAVGSVTGHTNQTADHAANIALILTDTGTTLDNHLTDIKGTSFVKDTHSLIDIETYVDLIDDGTSGLAKIATDAAATLIDTAVIGALGAGLTNINLPDQTMDITGNLSGSVGSVTGHTNQTADHTANIALILTDTGTTLQAELDGIQADTEDIQTRLPAALSSGNMKSDALAISTSTDAADKLEASAETMIIGAAEAGTLSATVMTSDLAEATNEHYNGRIVIWTSGVLIGQASDITAYLGSTGQLTYTAVTEAPTAADTFIIV